MSAPDDKQLNQLLASMTTHEKDLLIDCPDRECSAKAEQECKGLDPGLVHFGRRLKRLLKGIR